jgi:hypothetical protein
VPRPDVISKYFADSNVIDSHNQAQQSVLELEKHWITQSGWFRLSTTLIGMTITDCWRASKHAMPNKKDKEIPIKEFNDRMSYDCIHNCHSETASVNGYIAPEDDVPQSVGGWQSDVSSITEPIDPVSLLDRHVFKDNPELDPPDANGKQRPKRRRCPGCTEYNKGKPKEERRNPLTTKMCFHPQCLQRRYWAGGNWVYGVFYCPEHSQSHYTAILEGRGNV